MRNSQFGVKPKIPGVLYAISPKLSKSKLTETSPMSVKLVQPRRESQLSNIEPVLSFTEDVTEQQEKDPLIFKQYQILSEDARCDLHFVLENITGFDHIACRGYRQLISQLGCEKGLCLFVRQQSIWQHLLPIAAVCKQFDIPLDIVLDRTQPSLQISQLYFLYGALQLKARVVPESKYKQIQAISNTDLSKSLDHLVKDFLHKLQICFNNHQMQPDYIVVPHETTIFTRNDFVHALSKITKYKIVSTIETQSDDNPALVSWIQSMNQNISFGSFFFNIDRKHTGTVSLDGLKYYFDSLPNNLLQVEFSSYDHMHSVLFKEINNMFTVTQNQQEIEPVKCPRKENIQSFKQFLNATHTLATGMFITPLCAVMNYKFMFKPTDKIICLVTGAIITSDKNQDQCGYVDDYLFQCLEETYELVNVTVHYNTTRMTDTTMLMQIIKDNAISAHHFKFIADGVVVQCKSCSYDQIVNLKEQFAKAIKCTVEVNFESNIPHINKPKTVSFQNEKADTSDLKYESITKGFSDITIESVKNASNLLKKSKATDDTIIIEDKSYSDQLGLKIILQMENLQQTGSFKIRGASNMLLKAYNQFKENNQTIKGVVACSAGNHAQGVAKTAKLLGIKCTIVCPETAPLTKLYNTLRYGAEVIKYGAVFDISNTYAMILAAERGWVFVPPYNHLDVIEGQATIAHELMQQIKDIDYILVNVGGGGMISGIYSYAKLLNPNIKIIGIQASRVFPLEDYNKNNQLKEVNKTAATIADGCNVKQPGGIHNSILQQIDQYVSVDENEIAATIINVLLTTKTLCEGAGVMGLTALMYKKLEIEKDKQVAIVMCGGNIDIARLQLIYKLGSVSLGKKISIKLCIQNNSSAMHQLSADIQRFAGRIDDIKIEREVVDWDQAFVTIQARMPCIEATNELKEQLSQKYPEIIYQCENLIVK
ncbi:Threonine_dehydratase [Hexamita inflata]|uniref:Threonine dehydratase n=1 Tax=Hexamita inflata TaxID=28002 RepID=A0AA86RQK7_9EUKA|nr:Threonine dehydratase [Hexamita inflata]